MLGYQSYNLANRNRITITREDPFTGTTHQKTFEHPNILDHYFQWQDGKISLIQDALPYLSPSEREFIMTGITDESWDKYVVGDED